jgi:hypothetical protein
VLALLVEARFLSGKKSHCLKKANIEMEQLRYLFRLSKDLQCLSINEYEHSARMMTDIGKMIGGWQRWNASEESNGKEV